MSAISTSAGQTIVRSLDSNQPSERTPNTLPLPQEIQDFIWDELSLGDRLSWLRTSKDNCAMFTRHESNWRDITLSDDQAQGLIRRLKSQTSESCQGMFSPVPSLVAKGTTIVREAPTSSAARSRRARQWARDHGVESSDQLAFAEVQNFCRLKESLPNLHTFELCRGGEDPIMEKHYRSRLQYDAPSNQLVSIGEEFDAHRFVFVSPSPTIDKACSSVRIAVSSRRLLSTAASFRHYSDEGIHDVDFTPSGQDSLDLSAPAPSTRSIYQAQADCLDKFLQASDLRKGNTVDRLTVRCHLDEVQQLSEYLRSKSSSFSPELQLTIRRSVRDRHVGRKWKAPTLDTWLNSDTLRNLPVAVLCVEASDLTAGDIDVETAPDSTLQELYVFESTKSESGYLEPTFEPSLSNGERSVYLIRASEAANRIATN